MNDLSKDTLSKDKALTTADLAGAGPVPEIKGGPGPAASREYVEEPRGKGPSGGSAAEAAPLLQRLAESFSQERSRLEGQWDQGEDVSTEDLRVALQRYRSFFDRLLSV